MTGRDSGGDLGCRVSSFDPGGVEEPAAPTLPLGAFPAPGLATTGQGKPLCSGDGVPALGSTLHTCPGSFSVCPKGKSKSQPVFSFPVPLSERCPGSDPARCELLTPLQPLASWIHVGLILRH